MHAELLDLTVIAQDGLHNAFTSLCQWHGQYYCAWRVAPTHHITPPGHLIVSQRARGDIASVAHRATLIIPGGDCRDPRLLPTPDALFLLCGVYLPAPHHQGWHGLSHVSTENILYTHYSYTTNGETWAPLTPALRPNYWGWSALQSQKQAHHPWMLAAYQMGTSHDIGGSLALFVGQDLGTLTYWGIVYDGMCGDSDGSTLLAPHYQPCEPVLWQPAPDTLACCVRTEAGMDLGVSRAPFQRWQWTDTKKHLHPSAVIQTPHGWLLAVREVLTIVAPKQQRNLPAIPPPPPIWKTAIYELPAGHTIPRHLLTLPSGGDCGYAGMALGEERDTLLVSYYSQHRHEDPSKTSTLSNANVWLATVAIGT